MGFALLVSRSFCSAVSLPIEAPANGFNNGTILNKLNTPNPTCAAIFDEWNLQFFAEHACLLLF